MEKGVLRSCRPKACNFIKKETLAQVFSCEFCDISKNTFFTEDIRTTASNSCYNRQFFLSIYFSIRVAVGISAPIISFERLGERSFQISFLLS